MNESDARALRWDGKDRLVSAGDGLFLNVRRSSKTWVTRRRINGKMRVHTLGTYPDMKAKEARALALQEALQAAPSNRTVRDLAEDWFSRVVSAEQKRPELARGYLDRAVLPDLGARRVVELTPAEIAASIGAYRDRGPRSADSLRSVYVGLLTYAIETGVRADNPAKALTRRVAGYRPAARERVLTDDELRRAWHCDHHNARTLRFLLLTGLRISEAQKGHQDGRRWIVPAQFSKNGKAHWVHLPDSAIEQLPLPVSTPTNIQAWLRRWCAREGIAPPFTPHDCRRTAATRMAGAGVDPFIVERTLNHTLQGVMGVYNHNEYEAERIAAAGALERALLAQVKD
jgi:integrase